MIKQIDLIRYALPHAENLMDLPGNKIRTANLDKPIRVQTAENFSLLINQVNFSNFFDLLIIGDKVYA